MDKPSNSDLLFGFLSFLDQFSTVLVERGREYRVTDRGKQLEATLEQTLQWLDTSQQEAITAVASTIDGLTAALQSAKVAQRLPSEVEDGLPVHGADSDAATIVDAAASIPPGIFTNGSRPISKGAAHPIPSGRKRPAKRRSVSKKALTHQ